MHWPYFTKGRSIRNLIALFCLGFAFAAYACIWDGDTLEEDIQNNPKLADAILHPRPPAVDHGKLNLRLKELLGNRKEGDPDWWNNVAGTYLRLGQAAEAAKLLEPVVSRFEDNYGIHANLGTAYHLLGRYAEAEKHIARDLELNPEAHFGLEKYHLALLQYLARPKDYQARHLYVDEFTGTFYDTDYVVRLRTYWLMNSRDQNTSPEELKAKLEALTGTSEADQENRVALQRELAAWDTQPNYASKHKLAEDPKFQEGVIYMATLNPKEPACMTMLGMAALKSRDLNLAQKAFEKALLMGSPMEDVLKLRIAAIQEHIKKADGHSSPPDPTTLLFGFIFLIIVASACLWILVAIGRKIKRAIAMVILFGFGTFTTPAHACLWDSDTLLQEKWHSPKLADAILKPQSPKPDRDALEKRIAGLEANRKENEAAWWNDLAGAYIRLGHLEKAVALLESVVDRFENDYGIHANLGTSYHLMGRYEDAEKHIARDLEINPEAHYGLEKYHLALLQYLKESKEYQSRHLFVDELSLKFFNPHILFFRNPPEVEKLSREEIQKEIEASLQDKDGKDKDSGWYIMSLKNLLDPPPSYKKHWNLESNEKLEDGVIYMAMLNPTEPACWTMLGVVALKKRDLNLAAKAFEKAVALDAPMKELLEIKIAAINEHIEKAKELRLPRLLLTLIFIGIPALLVFKLIWKLRGYQASRKQVAT